MKMKLFLIALMVLVLPVMAFATAEIGGAVAVTKSEAGAISGSYINSFPNYIQPQAIYPYLLQIIPGVVGDVTDRDEMPKFADIQPLNTKTEKVLKSIYYTRGGRIAGFSRLEDFDSDLLDLIPVAIKKFGQQDTSKIRYKVLFKMSSKTIGANLGGGGAAAGFTSGVNPTAWGTNGSGLGSFAVNTADPKFIIKFYLVQ